MTVITTVYVSFPGNAREMLEYYRSVFGGELEIMTLPDPNEEAEFGED